MVNNYAPLSYDVKLAKIKQLNSNKTSNNEAIKICDAELEKDIFDMDFLNTKSISFYELKHDKDLSEKQLLIFIIIFVKLFIKQGWIERRFSNLHNKHKPHWAFWQT